MMSNVRSLVLVYLVGMSHAGCGAADVDDANRPEEQGINPLSIRYGVDYSWARPSPQGLRSAGYTFAFRYLSWDTTGKNLTAAEARSLIAAGVDVVANWEHGASEALGGYSAGVTNAQEAQRQANACGMPAGRPIYFSVDFDATPAQQGAINSYLDGAASVLGRERVGAYGGYYVIKRLFDAGKIRWGWQTYAWSGGQWDARAQVRQVNNNVTVAGGQVDIDQALAADFGQWGQASPPPPPDYSKWYVDTFATATGYKDTLKNQPMGQLWAQTNYVFCKQWGAEVRDAQGSYNHWWLLTDLDAYDPGQSGRAYVSAYYLSRWGNDEAKDNSGNVIPDCRCGPQTCGANQFCSGDRCCPTNSCVAGCPCL